MKKLIVLCFIFVLSFFSTYYYNLLEGQEMNLSTLSPSITWSSLPSLNVKREKNQSEFLNNKIYCIGGTSNSSTPLKTVEVLDISVNNSNWQTSSYQLQYARHEFASCVLNNTIYVFGGFTTSTATTNMVEYLNSTGWHLTNTPLSTCLADMDGSVFNSCFYTFGGITSIVSGNISYDNKIRKFKPGLGWTEEKNIPDGNFTKRCGYRCVTLGQFIYIIGGAYSASTIGSVTYYKEVWRYNPITKQLIQVASLSKKRVDLCCKVINGKIYAIGGKGDNGSEQSIEVFDPSSPSPQLWKNVTNIPSLSIYSCGCVVYNNKGYITACPDAVTANSFKKCYKTYQVTLQKENVISSTLPNADINRIFKIFPNPATNILTIEAPENSIIEILNIQGQLLRTHQLCDTKTNLDISTYPSGVYLIGVKTDMGVSIKRFVKN